MCMAGVVLLAYLSEITCVYIKKKNGNNRNNHKCMLNSHAQGPQLIVEICIIL